jgi:glycosyltransferase involved in cell wall biosynthesis
LSSGGDILFGNLGASIGQDPDWETAVLAPSFAAKELSRYFKTVLPLPVAEDEPLKLASAPARIPIVWYGRQHPGFDLARSYGPTHVYATGDFFPNVVVGTRLRRTLNTPFVSVVHHINERPFVRRNQLSRSILSYGMQRVSFRLLRRSADAIFLLNSAVRDELIRLRFAPERLHVVGAGIDVERFPFVRNPGSSRNLLWLHRLEPTKGIMDIGAILQELPEDVTIDIVGSGPTEWRSRLEDDLRERSLVNRARIHGYVDEERLRVLFENAATFISCSYEEGWGISISEALSCGIPCVAYNLPSIAEVFGDVVKTVPVGNTKRFAEAVLESLESADDATRRAARRRLVERFSYESLAQREKSILSSLVS